MYEIYTCELCESRASDKFVPYNFLSHYTLKCINTRMHKYKSHEFIKRPILMNLLLRT